jgi:transcriptional regulator with XRE-family HTH domain
MGVREDFKLKVEIDAEHAASWSRTYRASEGLSQRELARRLRTTPGVVGDLERGRVRSRRVATALMALIPQNLDDVI